MKKVIKILFFMFVCLFSIGIGNKAFAAETTLVTDGQTTTRLSNNNLTGGFYEHPGYVKANRGIASGKKYFEVKIGATSVTALTIGATYETSEFYRYDTPVGYYYQGYTYPSGTYRGKPYNCNDVVGVAIDLDSEVKTVSFYLNGEFVGKENIPNYIGQTMYPFVEQWTLSSADATANFGATEFKYSIPTGFLPYNSDSNNISLNKFTDNLQIQQTDTLVATITPTSSEIVWASSDSSIVTVDSTGKITAVKEGQATITAQIKGSETKATCVVTVTKDGTNGSTATSGTGITTGGSGTTTNPVNTGTNTGVISGTTGNTSGITISTLNGTITIPSGTIVISNGVMTVSNGTTSIPNGINGSNIGNSNNSGNSGSNYSNNNNSNSNNNSYYYNNYYYNNSNYKIA